MGTVDDAAPYEGIMEMLSEYEKMAGNLPPDKREACMRRVGWEADKLGASLNFLKATGMKSVDLKIHGASDIKRIKEIVKPFCSSDKTSKKMDDFDVSLKDFHHERPHHEKEEGVGTFVGKYAQGMLGHTIMHTMNTPAALAAETLAGTLLNRKSKSTGDKVAEAALDVGLTAGIDHAIASVAGEEAMVVAAELEGAYLASKLGKVPAFKLLLATEVTGFVAGLGEKAIKKYSDKHFPPDEHVGPCMDDGGCLNPYQSAYATQKLLQGVQVPAKALHAIPHVIIEGSKQALKYIGEHPPVPEVFP